MSFEHSQRRRVTVATALTVILVPAAFLLNRDDGDATDTTVPAAAGGSTVVAEEPTQNSPAATDVMGTSPIDLWNEEQPADADDPPTIAIPRLPESVSGPATYSRNIDDPANCMVPEAPFRARLTITNLDNSRTIDCINQVRGTAPPETAVLHTDAFLKIGDLTDAPVPVQVTW